MKRIYDIKLIRDYIEGNDIPEYDIDELENDYEFMISVINYTKDKNMYHLCSEEVKYNYEFVKFMVKKFSQDTTFICTVANDFLKKNKDRLKYIELLLIMRDLTRNKPENDENYVFYTNYFCKEGYRWIQRIVGFKKGWTQRSKEEMKLYKQQHTYLLKKALKKQQCNILRVN